MDEWQSAVKGTRSLVVVISILLTGILIFFITYSLVKQHRAREAAVPDILDGGVAVVTTAKDLNAPESVDSTGSSNMTVPEGEKESAFIKGGVVLGKWSASSIISNVTAEKVQVTLDEYDKGEKTGKTQTRNMYVAVVETRPARIDLIDSYSFTSKKLADISAIVNGYNFETDEDILFACSNECCAKDESNPLGHMYLNGDGSYMGTVIKNSLLAQQGDNSNSLVFYRNGKWEYPVRVSLHTSDRLIKQDAYASVSYTYPVIWNGKRYTNTEEEKDSSIPTDYRIADPGDKKLDRTLIGKINDNKYVFLISEGFTAGYLVDYMLNDLGVQYAYWGADGYATGMYIDGYGVITSNNYVAHADLFCVK